MMRQAFWRGVTVGKGCTTRCGAADGGRGLRVIERQVPIAGWTRSALNEEIRSLVQAEAGFRTLSVGLDQTVFSRTLRPKWALVLGIVLAPTLLGLAFLLVRTSEQFTWTVREDHGGMSGRLSGSLPASLVERVVAVCAAGSNGAGSNGAGSNGAAPSVASLNPADPGATSLGGRSTSVAASPDQPVSLSVAPIPGSASEPSVSAAPSDAGPRLYDPAAADSGVVVSTPLAPTVPGVSTPQADANPYLLRPATSTPGAAMPIVAAHDKTEMASSALRGASVAPSVGLPTAARVQLRDGSHVAVKRLALIGRDPAPAADEVGATLIAIPESTVSKTHLTLEVKDGLFFVTDRGSTNGSAVLARNGNEMVLPHGERHLLEPGSAVRVGTYWFVVEVDS